jgi:hypothetical protein
LSMRMGAGSGSPAARWERACASACRSPPDRTAWPGDRCRRGPPAPGGAAGPWVRDQPAGPAGPAKRASAARISPSRA